MKELVKQYLDQGISRRTLVANLGAAGLSAAAANTVAQALTPVSAHAAAASPAAVRDVTGTGGQLYLQQLKAAGVEYYFFNPSTGDAPIFDAFVDEPAVTLIKGVQEGVVVAMADGYARLSGKVVDIAKTAQAFGRRGRERQGRVRCQSCARACIARQYRRAAIPARHSRATRWTWGRIAMVSAALGCGSADPEGVTWCCAPSRRPRSL